MTNPTLVFADPPAAIAGPPPGHGTSPVALWLAEVRKHPGRWVRYPRCTNGGTGGHIQKGSFAGVEPGEFEACVRLAPQDEWIGKRRYHVYARFIGGQA